MLLHAFKFSWLMWIFSFVHLVAIRWWFSLFIFIDYQTYFSMSPWKCSSICWRTFLHSTFLLAGLNYSKLTMDLRLATSPVLIIWLGLRRSFSNLHPSVVLLLCVKWCVIIKFRTIFRFLEKKVYYRLCLTIYLRNQFHWLPQRNWPRILEWNATTQHRERQD